MIVREYEDRDEDACRALFDELVETHRALYPDGDVGGAFGPEEELLVAEDGGKVVGFAGMIRHARRAELEPIVVAESHRGRGIGRALVERVAAEARTGGSAGLFVRPTARNASALAFFRSIGFDVLTYVRLELDFQPRDRRPGESLAGLEFRT